MLCLGFFFMQGVCEVHPCCKHLWPWLFYVHCCGGSALLVSLLGGIHYVGCVLLIAIVKGAITTLLGTSLGAQGPTSVGYTPGSVFP